MTNKEKKTKLVNEVVEQIQRDISMGDKQVVNDLIGKLNTRILFNYLPKNEQKAWMKTILPKK